MKMQEKQELFVTVFPAPHFIYRKPLIQVILQSDVSRKRMITSFSKCYKQSFESSVLP